MVRILKNPLTIWLHWLFKSQFLLFKNRGKNLKIGYMSMLNNVEIGKYNTYYDHVTVSNSKIGDYTYVGPFTKISNATVGKFCSIGTDVKIGLGMHPTNYLSTFPAFFSTHKQCQVTFVDKNYFKERGNVYIGNDVWIGENAIIFDNIVIGDGAIIASGALVTKNVEEFSIVGGVPAKLISRRFDEEKIEIIKSLRWWDKDLNWIIDNIDLFNKKF